jgi:hypothetical protein
MKQDYVRGMISGIRFFLVRSSYTVDIVSRLLTINRKERVVCPEIRASLLLTLVFVVCAKVCWAIYRRL